MSAKTPEQVNLGWRLLDFLKNHGDRHDQTFWVSRTDRRASQERPLMLDEALCGTVACAAGWAVLLAGGELYISQPPVCSWQAAAGGVSGTVPYVAAHLLGLGAQESLDVFFARSEAEATYELDKIFTSGGDR